MELIRVGEEMIDVELVCDRDEKDDCKGGTPVVWYGKGDVQKYPARLWHKLEKNTDVWKLAEAKPAAPDAPPEDPQPVNFPRGPVTTEMLAGLPDDTIRTEAAARGYKLHPRLTPDNLRLQFLESSQAA